MVGRLEETLFLGDKRFLSRTTLGIVLHTTIVWMIV